MSDPAGPPEEALAVAAAVAATSTTIEVAAANRCATRVTSGCRGWRARV
ncbi:hypothetical protein ACFSTC_23390 [Nonomuraea ferruginea]